MAVSSGERASWNCRLGLHGPRLIGRRRLTPGRPVLMPIRHGLYSRTDRFLPLSPLERRLVSPTSVLHSFAPFHFLREKLAGLLEDIRPIPIRSKLWRRCLCASKKRKEKKKWEKEKRIYRSLEGREGREGWFEELMRLSDLRVEATEGKERLKFRRWWVLEVGSISRKKGEEKRRNEDSVWAGFFEEEEVARRAGCVGFIVRVEIERGEFAKSRQKLHLSWD